MLKVHRAFVKNLHSVRRSILGAASSGMPLRVPCVPFASGFCTSSSTDNVNDRIVAKEIKGKYIQCINWFDDEYI
jgi:hypothetical protein